MNAIRKSTHNSCKWKWIKFIFYTHQCKMITIKFCKFELFRFGCLHVSDVQRYTPNVHRLDGDTPECALQMVHKLQNCLQIAKLSTTRTHSAPGISLILAVIEAFKSMIVWVFFFFFFIEESGRFQGQSVSAWWTILQGLFRSVSVKEVDIWNISLNVANM